jgi:hypothetical protein
VFKCCKVTAAPAKPSTKARSIALSRSEPPRSLSISATRRWNALAALVRPSSSRRVGSCGWVACARRRAWLRIFVVRCGLPCDPPVGGHSCNGGIIPRFHRAVCGSYGTVRGTAPAPWERKHGGGSSQGLCPRTVDVLRVTLGALQWQNRRRGECKGYPRRLGFFVKRRRAARDSPE